jgi:23S rRNA pseudouridine1911/1915/1917 synthase
MSEIKVIYQDSDILVLDKPAGLVVTPADTIKDDTLSDILIRDFKINLDRGGVVHRLDKDTSGVLIVAKTQAALENLQAQFKERNVKKQYLALVHGDFQEEKTVSGAIARNPANREKFIVWDEDGKEAETKFVPDKKLLMAEETMQEVFTGFNKIQFRKLSASKYGVFTLLKCFPLTGRTHQIRVHLKYTGFPIVSDEKYGGRKTVRLDRRWCGRQFLHAFKLEFNHPGTGERVVYESPLADDLKASLKFLEENA